MKLKWKSNNLEHIIMMTYSKENKKDLSKTWKTIRSISKVRRKIKSPTFTLKHDGALLYPVKMVKTFNSFLTNIEPSIAKRNPKRKKSSITYLKNKVWKSFCFYPTTSDEII